MGREREALLADWRRQVRELPSAKGLDVPTLNDHIPMLIDELREALRRGSDETIPEALSEGSSPAHGEQRFEDAFDIEEIVAEYNILRGCVHDLADSNGLRLQGRPFHIVNRVLDGAIGLAVQAYATEKALEVQRRREEYLTFVAHDIRTPLNAMAMAVMVLERTLPERENVPQVGKMLKSLGRNVQQVAGLVAKVIEENSHSETELGVKLERRPFDLWALVESLILDLHPVAGTDSTQLVNEVPDDLVAIADANLVRRVFQNLIANSIKYTPRGRIEIGAREVESGSVECWVADNGMGISPDLLARVFHKGETDPEGGDGLGLGLAIVKTFVEAHGGLVSVESREGEGSRFRFTLPRAAAAGA
ncbi:two-component sensor histidine kinase [Betaproteobacteria bacterium GR16-43]|nr:two-component sensor histidine kinase [Betaproteobacteria bacterium GR16-43]